MLAMPQVASPLPSNRLLCVANCNYALDLCAKLGFTLINVAGTDLVGVRESDA